MPDQTQATTPPVVREVQKRVNLVSVRLFRTRAELLVAGPPSAEWNLDMTAKTGGRKLPLAGGFLQIIAGLEVDVRPKGVEQGAPVAHIEVEFILDYRIEDSEFYAQLKEDDVVAFGAINGMYNAWPYARAHVQAVAGAMSLMVVLPTYHAHQLFPDLLSKALQAAQKAV